MDKVDLKRTLPGYRARRGRLELVDVPPATYLMVDGHGDPNTAPDFAEAVSTLYPVAYRLKFASKRDLGRDYVVPPLEGLWWAEDMASFTSARDKSQWCWTLMLMVPDWIGSALVDAVIDQVGAGEQPARLDDLRLESLSEGRCVQTLHVGSFDDEAEVLAQMHEHIAERDMRLGGRHHEIYLSDRRRVAAEKQRTILRQPVDPA
ncbi:GyrI-like domain-containing protein [uncultured Nocardioides sp.]|uniref:GyrI-like domain-containing protein n=1 Tax=uncultured Nocardioides sp. TaxID=198441 RepID=UPI0030F583FA